MACCEKKEKKKEVISWNCVKNIKQACRWEGYLYVKVFLCTDDAVRTSASNFFYQSETFSFWTLGEFLSAEKRKI